MFGNMCIGVTHTGPTNQPTFGGRYVEGCRSRLREFPPLSWRGRVLTAATLRLSRTSFAFASLLTSSPAASPSPFTDGDGVCVYRRQSLPRPSVFRDSFRPESIPPSRRVETVGATAAGVQRVQTSVSGLSLVSLVTAPHKGIAL